MEFCPECDSVLLPKRGTNELYCRVCKKTYKVEKTKDDLKKEYRINHRVAHKASTKTAIVTKKEITHSISEDERRAFEDYFSSSMD
ncbi:MAG: hypothetical protein ACTSRZ_02800 [Promethearchaeota archaeon]